MAHNTSLKNFNIDYNKALFLMLLAFAILTRAFISLGYYNIYDTFWYRRWAVASNDGLFSIYSNKTINLDYPPVYLFFLYVVGVFYKIIPNAVNDNYLNMALMKFWPVLFDIVLGVAIYFAAKKRDPKFGVLCAAFWLFNPAALFNSAFWGQTDALMCLMIFASFLLMERHPVWASVMFALSGLTKFQSLYLLPVFLTVLIFKHKIRDFFAGVFAAAGTVVLVFLPFMIGSHNPFLFFDVYLNGSNSYPYATLNAFNIYGIFNLNWATESNKVLGGFTYGMLGLVLLIAVVISSIVLTVFAKKKCFIVLSLVLMQSIFMLTTKMHERYQFLCVFLCLAAFILYKKKDFFILFGLLSFVVAVNQAVPMFDWNYQHSIFSGHSYSVIMIIMSAVNFLVYLYSLDVCVKFLFGSEQE